MRRACRQYIQPMGGRARGSEWSCGRDEGDVESTASTRPRQPVQRSAARVFPAGAYRESYRTGVPDVSASPTRPCHLPTSHPNKPAPSHCFALALCTAPNLSGEHAVSQAECCLASQNFDCRTHWPSEWRALTGRRSFGPACPTPLTISPCAKI